MKTKYLWAALPIAAFLLVTGTAGAHWMTGTGNIDPQTNVANHTQMFEAQASLLGISVEEVKNAWAGGKSLHELALEKGIDEHELTAKMQTQAKERMQTHMQELVQAGVISQAQADQRLQIMQTRLEDGRFMKKLGRHGGKMNF